MFQAEDRRPAASAEFQSRSWVPSEKQLLGILFFYFILQVMLRCVMSPSALELDEAEQLVTTQKWSWGYSSQPPLYTWLQILFFNVFGVSVFALSLLKNLLLLGVYVLTFLSARIVIRSASAALAVAASVLFFPEISWQSQCDRTHSVLALFFVCATLFFFLRIFRDGRLKDFVLFGLCAGLSLLSKYNDAFFLVGLIAAGASLRDCRRALADKRFVLSVVVMLLVFLPNALWMWNHPKLALLTSSKFHIATGEGGAFSTVGLRKSALLILIGAAPMLLLHAAVFWRRGKDEPSAAQPPAVHLLLRAGIVIALLVAISTMAFHVTEIRERWLQPLLIFLPILSVAYFAQQLNSRRLKWILGIAAVVMVTVTAGVVLRLVFADTWRMPQRLNSPFRKLTLAMKEPLADVPVVLTETSLYGGNMRLNLPGKIYSPPEFAALIAPDTKRFAFVWDATKRDLPMERALEFLQNAGADFSKAEVRYFTAPCRFEKRRQMRLGLVILEKEKNGWPISGTMR